MKNIIYKQSKSYNNYMHYDLTVHSDNHWSSYSIYLHTSGMTVSCRVEYNFDKRRYTADLYIKWDGTEYSKHYPDDWFEKRGIRLICANFVKEVQHKVGYELPF